VYQRAAQASVASQTMLWTGIVILLFVLLHLAHYTFGWVHEADLGGGKHINYLELKDAKGQHDVYSMMVAGFRTMWLSAVYLVCQVLIGVHLSHGIQSTIQTLGLKGTRFAPAWVWLGYAVAALVVVGNSAIVLAVWTGFIPPVVRS
jgi:succinate dehydrogenase / fumarate reductase, cytochrome b subunit